MAPNKKTAKKKPKTVAKKTVVPLKPKSRAAPLKKLNLALQGGGSHGAFTWGALDAILRDGRFDIDAITATSAGSMNAAIMLYGLRVGGVDGACDLLEKFWHRVSETGSCFHPFPAVKTSTLEQFFPWVPPAFFSNAAGMNYLENIGQTVSPYRSNPFNINPLRDILSELIDFDQIQCAFENQIFISATNTRIGETRVFTNPEITLDVLMASAALPYLFQAVEIDGDFYWDGGYTGNPALWPLFYESETRDLLIVHVNPIVRPELPREAYEIENRLNEITFNSSLLDELRAIQFVCKLLQEDMLKPQYRDKYKDIRLHAIRAEDTMRAQGISSKYDTSWDFLTHLRDAGRDMAKNWIAENYDSVGKKATVNIQDDYLQPKKALNKTTEDAKTGKKAGKKSVKKSVKKAVDKAVAKEKTKAAKPAARTTTRAARRA